MAHIDEPGQRLEVSQTPVGNTNATTGSWWATLPGLLTAAAGFVTALGTLITILYQVHVLPFGQNNTSPSVRATTLQGTDVSGDGMTKILCSGDNDSWGKKSCGSTIIVFQPVYSGNDSAIITSNVGTQPIRIEITPICTGAPQCGKKWPHVVYPVSDASDGSNNQNLTINVPGVHEFNWMAYI